MKFYGQEAPFGSPKRFPKHLVKLVEPFTFMSDPGEELGTLFDCVNLYKVFKTSAPLFSQGSVRCKRVAAEENLFIVFVSFMFSVLFGPQNLFLQ